MAGLVGYASSDEDDDVPSQPEFEEPTDSRDNASELGRDAGSNLTTPSGDAAKPNDSATHQTPVPAEHSTTIGPSLPPPGDFELAEDDGIMQEDAIADPDRPPQSPYSANRSLIHDLTLPSVPDFDIPPSPPGSPPATIEKKFSQFLDLKKKGVHFNQKLEHSAALKNPNLMDKLMRFVELEGVSQYETTLSKNLWDPNAFPQWAYRENLKKSRDQLVKEREVHNASGSRKAVDFVPASKGAR